MIRAETRQQGFALPEALVGSLLGLAVILFSLALTSGLIRWSHRLADRSDQVLSLQWALDRISDQLRRCGVGVDAGMAPDESIELFDSSAFACRSDSDGLDPMLARQPEAQLGLVRTTGNDEVILFIRRNRASRGARTALFQADLHSSSQFTMADGTLVAERDAVVEWIDAGRYAGEGESAGVLYRVRFVHDARRFGSGRFRQLTPMADDVMHLSFIAYDGVGSEVEPCGGADDEAGLACRSSIRRVTVQLDAGETSVRRSVLLSNVETSK